MQHNDGQTLTCCDMLQWFSMERMRGNGEALKAKAAMVLTVS